ncbi:hypothetical protein TNCV_354291 [Trichonephila clavipes]|uniref:Uncharacterized protein n=1 Tax=Trichonephila clavipes TaxID=2585209 RepID=A0A8X6W141_TRICX|nr:hypothetical protein TNCV_354291 [Trichonephila clavipes]
MCSSYRSSSEKNTFGLFVFDIAVRAFHLVYGGGRYTTGTLLDSQDYISKILRSVAGPHLRVGDVTFQQNPILGTANRTQALTEGIPSPPVQNNSALPEYENNKGPSLFPDRLACDQTTFSLPKHINPTEAAPIRANIPYSLANSSLKTPQNLYKRTK